MESKTILQKYSEGEQNAKDIEDGLANNYTSLNEFWASQFDPDEVNEEDTPDALKKDKQIIRFEWYEKQREYWDNQPVTIDGVLGGYGQYHEMETAHSIKIFQEYTQLLPNRKRAFDVGCGIGRVTKFILSNVFDKVDLLDQSPAQITEAKNFLKDVECCGDFFTGGMQDHFWDPHVFYDLIWLQWFLMYLSDEDLVKSLK